jgi:hypothetical protein
MARIPSKGVPKGAVKEEPTAPEPPVRRAGQVKSDSEPPPPPIRRAER